LNVRKSHLIEKLQIFLDDPALLKNPEYEVQTSVDVPTFTNFVKSVQGESIDITAAFLRFAQSLVSRTSHRRFRCSKIRIPNPSVKQKSPLSQPAKLP
jgi:hypothetical protein